MRLNFINRINFQKKLVAKTTIPAQNSKENVNIYLVDKKKDYIELENASKMPEWQDAHFLEYVTTYFKSINAKDSIYTLENKQGKLLGFCVTKDKDFSGINFIETIPKASIYNQNNRPYKYIGETLLAYIARKTKEHKKSLLITGILKSQPTLDFYFKHCNFDKYGKNGAILEYDKLDTLIDMNKEHTGGFSILA